MLDVSSTKLSDPLEVFQAADLLHKLEPGGMQLLQIPLQVLDVSPEGLYPFWGGPYPQSHNLILARLDVLSHPLISRYIESVVGAGTGVGSLFGPCLTLNPFTGGASGILCLPGWRGIS